DAAGVNGSNRILFHGAPLLRMMPNGCLGSPVIVLLFGLDRGFLMDVGPTQAGSLNCLFSFPQLALADHTRVKHYRPGQQLGAVQPSIGRISVPRATSSGRGFYRN
ncbi:MAG TPA: hypothetical protein VKD72_23855, partial [Gemmataceae bacterium]|nr:hypothetical protein [Gemmataceae bacterium]